MSIREIGEFYLVGKRVEGCETKGDGKIDSLKSKKKMDDKIS